MDPLMMCFLLKHWKRLIIFHCLYCYVSLPEGIIYFHLYIPGYTRWFNSWPLYPQFGGHDSPFKGSRFHHPKKDTAWIIWYIYIYLEPQWPLFLKVNPLKQGLVLSKQGSFGFQVYILRIFIFQWIHQTSWLINSSFLDPLGILKLFLDG